MQLLWRTNLSLAGSEQQVPRPYPSQVSRATSVYILKHPAFGSVHRDAVQSRIDSMARRNVPHPGVPESGVAGLEFCYQPIDFLLECFGIVTCDYLISAAPNQGIPIRPVHRGIEMLGFHQPADLVKDLRASV